MFTSYRAFTVILFHFICFVCFNLFCVNFHFILCQICFPFSLPALKSGSSSRSLTVNSTRSKAKIIEKKEMCEKNRNIRRKKEGNEKNISTEYYCAHQCGSLPATKRENIADMARTRCGQLEVHENKWGWRANEARPCPWSFSYGV